MTSLNKKLMELYKTKRRLKAQIRNIDNKILEIENILDNNVTLDYYKEGSYV